MEVALIFIIGLIVGSFLNVVIYRLRNGRNIIFGRSFCPECNTQLRWYDLIPLLSFIYLRGRCRYCHKQISWQYPIVEVFSGLIWILVFSKNFDNFQFPISNFQLLNVIYQIFIFSALLVIAVYDFKWKIIPNKIVYPAIAATLIFNLFEVINPPFNPPLIKGGLGGVLLVASAAFLFFFLIYYFSRGRAMGLGDAKLAFLIGLFLSPISAISAFTLSFIIGAVFGIILIAFGKILPRYGKWGMKSQIAFGPFLALGAFIVFFFSDFIIKLINF